MAIVMMTSLSPITSITAHAIFASDYPCLAMRDAVCMNALPDVSVSIDNRQTIGVAFIRSLLYTLYIRVFFFYFFISR